MKANQGRYLLSLRKGKPPSRFKIACKGKVIYTPGIDGAAEQPLAVNRMLGRGNPGRILSRRRQLSDIVKHGRQIDDALRFFGKPLPLRGFGQRLAYQLRVAIYIALFVVARILLYLPQQRKRRKHRRRILPAIAGFFQALQHAVSFHRPFPLSPNRSARPHS